MPRAPRLLAGLSIANGALTLATAIVFAATVVVLGNSVFLFSPFHVPRNWHVASIGLSAFVFFAAFVIERPWVRGWASWLMLLGTSIGGAATIAPGGTSRARARAN